jgi:hypothetical protein
VILLISVVARLYTVVSEVAVPSQVAQGTPFSSVISVLLAIRSYSVFVVTRT